MVSKFQVVDEKVEAVPASKQALRLWLRLLSCSTMIEQRMRHLLKDKFGTTLPRFDFMATLYRFDEGLSMGELSRWLMVSNGNVTGVADRLEKEGMIRRVPSPNDRRSQIVTMTPAGRAAFEEWAREHERWINDLFGKLDTEEMGRLIDLLAKVKDSVAHSEDNQS
ncbi:MAG: MarR family transcriptional regulator [Alphaproteobacteria bacterium]|nr:MAG: MarR family transcriptional regulator [Alphaproteobacteria bacterium]